MKHQKLSALFFAMILTVSLAIPAKAAGPAGTVTDLGDGFYVVEVLNVLPSSRSNDIVSGV